jgi:hypothetical protein
MGATLSLANSWRSTIISSFCYPSFAQDQMSPKEIA